MYRAISVHRTVKKVVHWVGILLIKTVSVFPSVDQSESF